MSEHHPIYDAETDVIEFIPPRFQGRLDALYRAAMDAYDDAGKAKDGPRTLAGATLDEGALDAYQTLKADYDTFRIEAVAAGTSVTVRALRGYEWSVLKEKHPPRTEGTDDEVQGDRAAGLNAEAVGDDLIRESVVQVSRTGTPTEFQRYDDEKDEWEKSAAPAALDKWMSRLSPGWREVVVAKAWAMANGQSFNPKSLPGSSTRSSVES